MYEGAVQDLIDELGRLPGVGPKSAQRIAFHLLAAESADVTRLVAALTRVQQEVRFCVTCYNVAEAEQCRICRDPRRVDDVLCVVEEPKDVVHPARVAADPALLGLGDVVAGHAEADLLLHARQRGHQPRDVGGLGGGGGLGLPGF